MRIIPFFELHGKIVVFTCQQKNLLDKELYTYICTHVNQIVKKRGNIRHVTGNLRYFDWYSL